MVPRALLDCKLWKFVKDYLSQGEGRDLNKIAREIYEKHEGDKLVSELTENIENMDITKEEYNLIVEHDKWLNWLGVAVQVVVPEMEELKEGEEE